MQGGAILPKTMQSYASGSTQVLGKAAADSQIFAITTAIILSYIPNVEQWFRSALAPAIVIPGMAKLGIIHPPAGVLQPLYFHLASSVGSMVVSLWQVWPYPLSLLC